jgi:hypothetical protein
MYLASHMTQKSTQVSSILLATTPLSILHIHPMEISQVVAVELQLCMRHGVRRNFKATAKFQWKLHQRIILWFRSNSNKSRMNQMQRPLTGLLVLCFLPQTVRGNAERGDGSGGYGTAFTGVLLAPARYYPPPTDRVSTHMRVFTAPVQYCAAFSQASEPTLFIVTPW